MDKLLARFTLPGILETFPHQDDGVGYELYSFYLKKNQNAPRPSEHVWSAGRISSSELQATEKAF